MNFFDEKTILQIYNDWKKKPQKKETDLPTANEMLGIYKEVYKISKFQHKKLRSRKGV